MVQRQFHKQRGVTLVVTLIFLFVLLMVGISAVRISLVEEKMTGNLRDKHIAFEAAESALSAAETWLQDQQGYPTPTGSGTNNVWSLGAPGSGKWWSNNALSWWTSNAITAPTNSLQSAAPRYVIEERAFVQTGENLVIGVGNVKQGKYYYQVTARGQGGSTDTRAHLRTTFIKRYD